MKTKEKWEEIYSKDELTSIQMVEKNILKEFIRVCNTLNLEYIIYGGTLLGQVKYGDMIPWDDDIDVAMPREDYTRFLNEASSVISNDYIIQSPYNEKKSPFSYTKIRRKGTTFIEEYNDKLDIEKGIYIDLYPIDNIPNDDKSREKQWKKARKYCYLYYLRQCKHANINKNGFINYLKHSIVYHLLRLLPQEYYINKIDYNMSKYDNTNTNKKACLFSPNINNIYTEFYPLIDAKFGDISVKIPNCYEDHLYKRYGDYKKDLPKDKRIGHIPCKFDIPKNIMEEEMEK